MSKYTSTCIRPIRARFGAVQLLHAGALALCALLASACFGDSRGENGIAGDTFPALDTATVELLDAENIQDVDEVLTVIASTELDAEGRFPRQELDPRSAVVVAKTIGGSFLGFVIGVGDVTFDLDNDIDVENLRAAQLFIRGKTRVAPINPLTDISLRIALFLNLEAGEKLKQTVDVANLAMDDYFTTSLGGGEVAEVELLKTQGEFLWGPEPFGGARLNGGAVIGLVTAGLIHRANTLGLPNFLFYLVAVGADAADGAADGLVHQPFASEVSTVEDAFGIIGYPDDPLGDALADDIETFVASDENTSDIDSDAADPLVQQLRVQEGDILKDVPRVLDVQPGPVALSRQVIVSGTRFDAGAQVFFGDVQADATTVLSGETELLADVPGVIADGSELFVTVINSTGRRHSLFATIVLP